MAAAALLGKGADQRPGDNDLLKLPGTIDGDRRLGGIWAVGGAFCGAHLEAPLALEMRQNNKDPHSKLSLTSERS